MNYLKSYFWTLPFLSFILGYLFMNIIAGSSSQPTPELIGLSIQQGISLLSSSGLNAQVLHEKIDPDLPNGTIINQTPHGTASIKKQQTVFLTLSKKPDRLRSPNYVGLYDEYVKQCAKKDGILIRSYTMPHAAPKGICIAQSPHAGTSLKEKIVICYCSSGDKEATIMPTLIKKPLEEVITAIEEMNYSWRLMENKKPSKDSFHLYKVTHQKPLAGTILPANQPITIQLGIGIQ